MECGTNRENAFTPDALAPKRTLTVCANESRNDDPVPRSNGQFQISPG